MKKRIFDNCFIIALALLFSIQDLPAQEFLLGADLSYVNEMEDCGEVYKENNIEKDPYQIFADHHCGLVRLRLWHTPSWYDGLNNGNRYSDLADVRKSILRAKSQGMKVLLDFHLSDTWADPSRQLIPAAWESIADNLPLLKDSLYQYIYNTLSSLDADGLLPEMVQIGNETNKGIMQTPEQNNGGWVLDWDRNSQLFNRAIEAVRDVETVSGSEIQVALHIADPADAGWLMQGFWSHGVTDFDIIGMSYYWAWHQPLNIMGAGNIVAQLKQTYPGKQVMFFETGYIWTTASNDNANNIINAVHPDYAPASPQQQKQWLIDFTQEAISKGASGIIYWEPAWVSSSCWTQWGQGSHQEHATFFDFNNNVLPEGGLSWMDYNYTGIQNDGIQSPSYSFEAVPDSHRRRLQLFFQGFPAGKAVAIRIFSADGQLIASQTGTPDTADAQLDIELPVLPGGIYYVAAEVMQERPVMRKFNIL